MALLNIDNNESGLSVRNKLNDMFNELFTAIIQGSNLKDFVYKASSFTLCIENIENITLVSSETSEIIIQIPNNLELAKKQAIIKIEKMVHPITIISESGVIIEEQLSVIEKQSITIAFDVSNTNLKAIFI